MMSLMYFVHKFLLSCRTLEANAPHFLQHLRPCHMWKLRLHLFYLSFSDFNIAESNTKTKRSTPRWASLFCISCIIWCSGKHHSYIYEELQLISLKEIWKISILLSHYLIVLSEVLAKYCFVCIQSICYFGIHTAFPALFLGVKSAQNICTIVLVIFCNKKYLSTSGDRNSIMLI